VRWVVGALTRPTADDCRLRTDDFSLNLTPEPADSYFMRKLLLVAALVGFMISILPGTSAAACTPPSTEDGLRVANVVFVGTVESVSNDERTAVFDVHWVWKGKDVEQQVTVYGESIDDAAVSADDRRFQIGITYLLASTTAAPPYRSDRCTATRFWRESGNGGAIPSTFTSVFGDVTPTRPIPIAAEEESSTLLDNPFLPIGVGVGVALLLIFAIGKVFRGPERVTGPGKGGRKRRSPGSRLPSVGRVGEGRLSGGFRRSGVTQAKKLRTRRKSTGKRSRKSRTKKPKDGLRTDRLASSETDADADVTA
jgi:hypothetical protein